MEPLRRSLTVVIFYADGHPLDTLIRDREAAFQRLRSLFDLELIPYNQYIITAEVNATASDGIAAAPAVCLPFIASGGSEALLLRYRHLLPAPLALLYDPYHNSLPAALEIASALEENPPVIALESLSPETVTQMGQLQQATQAFQHTKAALIGEPSPWLVASTVTQTEGLTRKLGIRFEKIDPQELIDRFDKTQPLTQLNETLCNQLSRCPAPESLSIQVLQQALRIHQCIEQSLAYHGCNALTLRCFDVIAQCGASPCLSLALLNQHGIPAACEGDIPSLMTLLSVKYLTGQPAFMANPNDFDPRLNTVTLAHCTVPLQMPATYSLNTHFETGCSVAVDGRFPENRPYTLVKWAQGQMQRYYAEEGISLPCNHLENRCRTQMRLQLNHSFDTFREKGMANHVIVVEGHHKNLFDAWNRHLTSLH